MITKNQPLAGESVFDTCVICRLSSDRVEYVNGVPYCPKHARSEKDKPVSRQFNEDFRKGKTERQAILAKRTIVYDAPK